jgi:hypothetical protein
MVTPSSLLLVAGLASVAGCRTWRPAGPAGVRSPSSDGMARAVAAASGPDAGPVRLITRSGEAVVLLAPSVERDSVVGAEARSGGRRAVALRDVGRVDGWRVSARRTLVAVAVGALAAAATVYAALTAWTAGNV